MNQKRLKVPGKSSAIHLPSHNRNFLYGLIVTAAVLALLAAILPLTRVSAAGTITGTVYIDYNMNGVRNTTGTSPNLAVDIGIRGATVTAYDSAGTVRGTTTVTSNGTYSLAATGTGPYRLEFTNLPSGYHPSAVGTNNGSTVRFVPDGNSSNIDLGLINQQQYCQNNPELVTTCFSGTVASPTTNDPVLVSFPYESGTTSTTSSSGVENPTSHALMVPHNNAGSIWGLAYHRRSQKIFAAAFTKRHAGFRNTNKGTASNDPTGEIFISDPTGTTASLFVNLNSLYGSNIAGDNPHDTSNYQNDASAFDAVGKTAFGDIALSEDEETLYVVNLYDRKLYAIPLGSGTPTAPTASGQVQIYDLAALMNPGTGATGCPLDTATPVGEMNRNLRPGGLHVSGEDVYVGLTCTAQSTNNVSHLRTFVYKLDPAGSGSATQVVNIALNYPRGCVSNNGTVCAPAEWNPWTATDTALLDYTPWGQKYYPQPWLTDIEVDQDGYMILGVSDRIGHQTGNDNAGANTGQVEGVAAGDTLRLTPGGGSWTLENNASDGTNTTSGANNGEGPGNGEFYYQEGYTVSGNTHSEITLGGLLVVPGFQDVVISAFDPAPTGSLPSGQNTYRAGGVIWLHNKTGQRSRSYQLFSIDTPNTFGKASGIGDMEAMCNTAPLQVGNRVWNDANGNGVQDPGEAAISGVTVQLWADTDGNGSVDAQIGTATTDANGNYLFGGAGNLNVSSAIKRNTNYQVRVPASNFGGGAPLNGLSPTTANNDASANGDARDSDGIVLSGNDIYAPFTTGTFGQNDHRYDFGFRAAPTTYSVGNRVWFDTDNDGIIDAGESGISGVSVSLFADTDGNGQPDSPSSPLATVTTDADGYYRFDGLAAEKYVIRINPSNFQAAGGLSGYKNTANGTAPTDDGNESSGAASNSENGVDPTGPASGLLTSGILSNSFTLGGAAEPVSEADVPSSGSFAGQGSFDNEADMTVDFGFYRLSLSGTVWHDNGNGTPSDADDGQLDAAEQRLSNYTVRLFDSANNEIPVGPDGVLGTSDDATGGVQTDASGGYSFEGLTAGTYRVVLTPVSAGSSTPTETDPNLNVDDNDNGFPDNTGNFASQMISGLITLTPGSTGAAGNNTVSNAAGSTSDPTVDFGLLLAPTQVKLEKFGAYYEGGRVVVEWSTGAEAGNLGFNVYRETNGVRELLTPAPVAGSALRTAADLVVKGDGYRWIDTRYRPGAVYYLEDLDIDGANTLHGPVRPEKRFSLEFPKEVSSALLTDLAEPRPSTALQEFVFDGPAVDTREDGSEADASPDALAVQRRLAAGPGVRLSVRESGWYRFEAGRLAEAGFDTGSDPGTWRLYADGREVPLRIGRSVSGAPTIEFYGHGTDTSLTDERVYYLVRDGGAGLRLPVHKNPPVAGGAAAAAYPVTVRRRDRALYASLLLNGDRENWFGPLISPNGETTQVLTVRHVHDDGSANARLRVRLQGVSQTDHLVTVTFNGVQLGTVGYTGRDNREFEFEVPMSAVAEGVNRVGLRSAGASHDYSVVDSVELRYMRGYRAANGFIRFGVEAGRSARIGGFAGEDIALYEIASGGAVRELAVDPEKVSGGAGFSVAPADRDREFIAFDRGVYAKEVFRAAANRPSAWHDPKNEADLIVLTPAALRAEAGELAALRESRGLRTAVVDIEDVWDEYSFGERSTAAVRSFLRDASELWNVGPRYVLLFGDSSFDRRNYLGQPARDLVPTRLIDTRFMETASDGWLADFDGDGVEDLALGRLPAGNREEAARLVAKLRRYDAQSPRKNDSNLLVADLGFEGFGDLLEGELPEGAGATRVDRAGMNDSRMREEILAGIGSEPKVVTFAGHGSVGFWTGGRVFEKADANALSNRRLSFFMLMTCLNGFTHDAANDSLAEALIRAENGAVAVWASSGSTYAAGQTGIGRQATRDLFGGNVPVGELIRTAKRATADPDVRRTWQLIGDPTIVIR